MNKSSDAEDVRCYTDNDLNLGFEAHEPDLVGIPTLLTGLRSNDDAHRDRRSWVPSGGVGVIIICTRHNDSIYIDCSTIGMVSQSAFESEESEDKKRNRRQKKAVPGKFC